ncbi:MAG: alkaline phosphatase D family protein, partial [Myxococcota bacterium]
ELVEPRVGASAGRFMTAPDRGIMSPLVFAWGGDLAGQNVCRDAREGFPVFKALVEEPLDFFIALGDMIYADNGCDATGMYGNAQVQGGFGPAVDMEGFRAHWRYNRQDQGYQRLLSQTPTFAIWDDHEVVNDFGPTTDTRADPPYTKGQPLMPMGLRAFLEYNPVGAEPATAKQIWRSFRWGGHLEVFILDTRQYRAPNNAPDDGPEAKSMLGEPQRQWLVKQVTASKATWKVIISSVPIAIPTGAGATARDGWTAFDGNTGFARELGAIVKAFHDAGTQNLVWMTTDVHFASVFRYTPFPDSPGFVFHEFVTGPLNAGLFPNRDFTPSMGAERLFFYGPESKDDVSSWKQARPWMNFGVARISEEGVLTIDVRQVDGTPVYTQALTPR